MDIKKLEKELTRLQDMFSMEMIDQNRGSSASRDYSFADNIKKQIDVVRAKIYNK